MNNKKENGLFDSGIACYTLRDKRKMKRNKLNGRTHKAEMSLDKHLVNLWFRKIWRKKRKSISEEDIVDMEDAGMIDPDGN